MQNDVATTRSYPKFAPMIRAIMLCSPLALSLMHAQPVKAENTVEIASLEMAGVSAAVTGDVTMAKATGEIGVLVESGMPVYLGDRITTTSRSGMQILLLDETVFTIGPNSDIAIDAFVYDPATGDGRIVADMARGVMRFVTGKIPLNNPSSMDINLPVGSIGIRGTIGLIRSVSAEEANQIMPGSFDTSTPESANQQVFMAVNQGPGLARNDTTSRPGAFAVTDQNGNSENITGENFGVFVSGTVVTEPARFPQDVATFDFSTNLVRTASRRSDETGGSSSGQTTSAAVQSSLTSDQTQQANTQTGSTMVGSLDVALAQVGTTSTASNLDETTSIVNNVESANSSTDTDSDFTYDAMRQVTTGTYTSGSIAVSSGALSYNFVSSVNFTDREMSITFQNIKDGSTFLTLVKEGDMRTGTVDFSGSSGKVTFSGTDFTPDANCTNGGCEASATFTDAFNVDFDLKTDAVTAGASGSTPLN